MSLLCLQAKPEFPLSLVYCRFIAQGMLSLSKTELPLRGLGRERGSATERGFGGMPLLQFKSAGSQADLDWVVQAKTQ